MYVHMYLCTSVHTKHVTMLHAKVFQLCMYICTYIQPKKSVLIYIFILRIHYTCIRGLEWSTIDKRIQLVVYEILLRAFESEYSSSKMCWTREVTVHLVGQGHSLLSNFPHVFLFISSSCLRPCVVL